MPWSAADADRHIKGLSAHQKRAWAAVANRALASGYDEGRAIRIANAAAKKVCVRCGALHGHKRLFKAAPY